MGAVADKLREARALIERGWTQGWFARTAAGNDCWYSAKEASCWCVTGALFRVAISVREESRLAGTFLAAIDTTDGIAGWNDVPDRTQAEVLAAFDRAIELAEKSA